MGMGSLTFMLSTENEGVPVGPEFQVNSYTFSNQDYSAAAMNDSGNFVIAWQSAGQDGDDYGIFAQYYDDNGNPFGIEFQVNSYTVNAQTRPSAAMDTNGNFVITWESNGQDGSGYGVFAQLYDNVGNPVGSEIRVNSFNASDQGYPSAAMDSSGNFVIAWESNGQDGNGYGIYAQRYDNIGNPVGFEFQVNTYNTTDQRYPSAAMDSNGNFVITWESNGQDGSGYGIYAQQYDNIGNPVGFEFRVNTVTVSNQRTPSVAMNTTGDFVVTWVSWFQDGDNWGVFAQHYDSGGSPLGTEFQVNTYTINFQTAPSVDMDSAGNFVITWMSYVQDGDWGGIYAQQYDNRENPLGREFLVNTYTMNDQANPSIAMDSEGNFVIAWQSNIQDGFGYGIFTQRFNNKVKFEIFDIQVGDITDTGATITWESVLPANSTVEYGFSTAFGLSVENTSKVIFHNVNLTGLEPGRLYHFRVVSYNDSLNYSTSGNLTFTTKFLIDLEPGWNMISLPMNQTDTSLGNVLGNISGDYDKVQWYDVSDTMDPWKHNHFTKPLLLNDLQDLNRYMGIWIHITNPAGTTIERAPPLNLPPGVDVVQWYNATSGLWENWDPGTFYDPDTFTLMKPGQGYWIHNSGITDLWSLEYVN
jgi:hypothetical protein